MLGEEVVGKSVARDEERCGVGEYDGSRLTMLGKSMVELAEAGVGEMTSQALG